MLVFYYFVTNFLNSISLMLIMGDLELLLKHAERKLYLAGIPIIDNESREKRLREVIRILSEVTGIKPADYAPAYAKRGIVHFKKRWFQDAIYDLVNAIELDPDITGREEEIVRCLGVAYYNISLENSGIDLPAMFRNVRNQADKLSGILSADPHDAYALLLRGIMLNEARNYGLAAEDFTCFIGIKPKSPLGYYFRSVSLKRQRQFYTAMEDLKIAASLDPDRAEIYAQRIKALSQRLRAAEAYARYMAGPEAEWNGQEKVRPAKKPAKATSDAQTQADVSYPADNYERAKAQYVSGEIDDAYATLCMLIESEPSNAAAFVLRGCILNDAGVFEPAVDDFTEAIAIDPTNPDTFYYRSVAWHQLGEPKLAIADFERAAKHNPAKAGIYGQKRAAIMVETGIGSDISRDSSTMAADEVLRRTPEYIQAKLEEFNQRRKIAEEFPGSPQHYRDAGIELLNQGIHDKALEKFRALVALEPDNIYSYYYLANTYMGLGNREEAVKNYLKVIELTIGQSNLGSLTDYRPANIAKEILAKLGVGIDKVYSDFFAGKRALSRLEKQRADELLQKGEAAKITSSN